MPTFGFQQDLDKVAQNLGALEASKDPTTVPSVKNTRKAVCQDQLQQPLPGYTPPIDDTYKTWQFVQTREPVIISYSPVSTVLPAHH